jgi:hypothetical protein
MMLKKKREKRKDRQEKVEIMKEMANKKKFIIEAEKEDGGKWEKQMELAI